MKALKLWIAAIMTRIGHRAEHMAHMTYLGLVGVEGKGTYKYAAIVLLIVVVLNLVANLDE